MEHLCAFVRRLFEFRSAVIDTCLFRLHYKLTFPLLLAISILVTWRIHFGTAIQCISRDSDSSSFINEFCYIHSTSSDKTAFEKEFGNEVPYPGINKNSQNDNKIYHTYYQWVPLVLFIQALMFVLPRLLWRYMEAGRIEDITKDLAKLDAGKQDLREDIVRSFATRLQSELNQNWKYFSFYVMAEIFNVVNVIGQIFMMNAFLNGNFLSYGPRVAQFSNRDWLSGKDPEIILFPRIAHCSFHQYGSSGDVQRHSIMCLLPLNSLYSKVYAFLWFWFVLLAIVSCLSLVLRLVFCLSTRLRVFTLTYGNRFVDDRENLVSVVSRSSAADCFLIRLLKQNMGSADFRDVMGSLERGKKFLED